MRHGRALGFADNHQVFVGTLSTQLIDEMILAVPVGEIGRPEDLATANSAFLLVFNFSLRTKPDVRRSHN